MVNIFQDVNISGELITGLTVDDILLSIAFLVAFIAGILLAKILWDRWY